MIFLISLPMVLSKTIGLKDLGELYNNLLGFGITTIIDVLKWDSQKPRSRHALAILIILFKHSLFWSMCLRWLHDNLSGLGIDKLLHLAIAFLNSFLEKGAHEKDNIESILLRILSSMLQCRAVLKDEWRAYYRSLISRHGWSLYLIASMASNLHLLT